MNNQQNKMYYVYSIFAVVFGMLLLALLAYFIYDIFLKLATNKFNNITLIQTIITLILTIFLGGAFQKRLELKNNKKLETYKTQKEIALKIIDLCGLIIFNNNSQALDLLYTENLKSKLFFDDSIVKLLNEFIEDSNKQKYLDIVDSLKKFF